MANDLKLLLVNIYCPNKDDPDFYQELENIIINNASDYTVICGDFYIALNPPIDSKNYASTFNISNPKSRKKILGIMNNLDLVDAFRHLYPNLSQFTWRKPKSNKMARLDYFLVSSSLMDLIPEVKIK